MLTEIQTKLRQGVSARLGSWNFLVQKDVPRNPEPDFARFTMKIEATALPGIKIDAPFVKKCFDGLIKVADMQAFGEMQCISPDHFKPSDIIADYSVPKHVNAFQFITTSNVSFYFFIDSKTRLISILIDTCKESEKKKILDYVYAFIKPDNMRFQLIHSAKPLSGWEEYRGENGQDLHPERKYLNLLMDILNYKSLTERKDVLARGAALEQIVLAAKSECNGRLLACLTPEEQKRSQDLYGEYELILERDHAHGILDGSIPISQPFIFHDRYMQINRKEAEALSIQPGQTVGMIGAGYNGETAFNIVDISGAHVIAYEKEKERADILRQLIAKKGYNQKITVITGKVGRIVGEPFHSSDYDVYSSLRKCDGGYIIAALARGKPYIYDELMGASYKYECTVVRTTEDDRGLLYRPTNTNLFNTDYYQLESKKKYVNVDPNGILSFSLVQRILNSPLYSIIHEPEEWKEE
ncbi:hypothetical protein HZC27_01550 [Candidatus Roizmanbacteria bacterium]|nr:hypothetical protein [Candidatus Roizmanbacteria bacterium]